MGILSGGLPRGAMARVLAVNAQGKAMDVVEAEGRLAPVATARSFLALLSVEPGFLELGWGFGADRLGRQLQPAL